MWFVFRLLSLVITGSVISFSGSILACITGSSLRHPRTWPAFLINDLFKCNRLRIRDFGKICRP